MREQQNPWEPFIPNARKEKTKIFLPLLLFIATFFTTSIAGVQWSGKDFTDLSNINYGFTYAILILIFLGFHEFGHYFASRIHRVDATLPYFIPITLPYSINFGTFGAVIRTKTPIPSRKALFDIGVAGPLAGFAVCLAYLIYGLQTLPPREFIYQIHPDYLKVASGAIPHTGLYFGDTILFRLLAGMFTNPNGWLPPLNEIYHYPFLCVGWFGMFVTTLNMLPIGQLDGGHITFAMFGKLQRVFARIAWWVMIIIGLGSLFDLLRLQLQVDYASELYTLLQGFLKPPLDWIYQHAPWFYNGWGGWLFWGLITRLFIKMDHPPVQDMRNIGTARMIVGWVSIIILFLSFSWNGIYFVD